MSLCAFIKIIFELFLSGPLLCLLIKCLIIISNLITAWQNWTTKDWRDSRCDRIMCQLFFHAQPCGLRVLVLAVSTQLRQADSFLEWIIEIWWATKVGNEGIGQPMGQLCTVIVIFLSDSCIVGHEKPPPVFIFAQINAKCCSFIKTSEATFGLTIVHVNYRLFILDLTSFFLVNRLTTCIILHWLWCCPSHVEWPLTQRIMIKGKRDFTKISLY